jgi:lipid II:glycine glycyltransferase (peptidoglycan interpeptide bridge formation enzyme)
MTYEIAPMLGEQRWDSFVAAHPDAHLLQSANWGRLKSAFGWFSRIAAIVDTDRDEVVAGGQILFRRLPFGLGTLAYLPAGPLFCGDDPAHPANRMLWQAIDAAARRERAVFLKVEPCDWYRPRPDLPGQLTAANLRPSPQTIQPPRTIVIDLAGGEEAVLKRMNQSTRYKVKLGPKKEVEVRESDDVDSFNRLIAVTGERDRFGVHDPAYYRMAHDLFSKQSQCALLMASHAGRDLAGVMVFRCGSNAYYLYGASSDEERNRMPTYNVQWVAIQWAIRCGAARYDLWGVPDADPETLDADFEKHYDGLWGVYGFKRGFGGQIVRSVGAWDKVYNPPLYALYLWTMQRRKSAPMS